MPQPGGQSGESGTLPLVDNRLIHSRLQKILGSKSAEDFLQSIDS